MGITTFGRNVVIIVMLAYMYQLCMRKEVETHVDGHVDEKWKLVEHVFRRNLEENWERGGAAFVVYHKGRKVVDIWGGYADKECGRLWKKDTLSIAFSCSKAMGSIVIAKLVDEGKLSYDDLVTKYWPEFGKNGKENVTIDWLINHKAGLAYTDHPISLEDVENTELLDKIFGNQRPNWPPGTEIGYHAVTHGWLLDAIVRRVDEKKRTIGQYFKQEIADKFGIDFYLGLPLSEQHRVSRISNPSAYNVFEEILYSPSDFNIRRFISDKWNNGTLTKVEKTTPWIQFIESMTLNDPALHRLEQSAVMGIGTARAMAQVFELLRTGKIVSDKTKQLMFSNYELREDLVTGAKIPRGKGFIVREFEVNKKKIKLYGHSGYGGQNIRTDFENEVTIAYLSNALKVGFGDTARTYKRLVAAVYDVVINEL